MKNENIFISFEITLFFFYLNFKVLELALTIYNLVLCFKLNMTMIFNYKTKLYTVYIVVFAKDKFTK